MVHIGRARCSYFIGDCAFFYDYLGAQGEGLCSYCLFLSVVTKVTQVGGKLGGFTDSTSKGAGFFYCQQ